VNVSSRGRVVDRRRFRGLDIARHELIQWQRKNQHDVERGTTSKNMRRYHEERRRATRNIEVEGTQSMRRERKKTSQRTRGIARRKT
jgi:phage terminase Nu1 subunit (DNA packaging protein)